MTAQRNPVRMAARRIVHLLAIVTLAASHTLYAFAADATAITVDTAASIRCLTTLPGHANTLLGLAFSQDGRLFGSSTLDGVVQVWDRSTWQVIHEFSAPSLPAWRLFFLADNARISLGNGTVWNIASGELEHVLTRSHKVAFSSDGVWMAAHGEELSMQLWRTADWNIEQEIDTDCLGSFLAFSPDGQILALAVNESPNNPNLAVTLWDVATGNKRSTLRGHQNIVHGLAFSPDGQWVAVGSMDTTIRVWEVQTGQLLHTLQTGGGLFDIAFSPDSTMIAAALDNRTAELWDVANERRVTTLNHGGEVVSVAFSPDGTLLASGAYDSKIYLWGIPH
ncbi:WD40 repeat domain-containing protein [Candidatus Bipolaricaulota bacterium]|nr:WD40 repeat domain-containing protein [Candidatus Bipolaricaulota bacterium]